MLKKIRNILVFIFFIQLLIFAVQNIENHKPKFSRNNEFSLESISIDEVREFEIKDKSGNLKFQKIENDWFLNENGARASSEKIEKFFVNLKAITKSRSTIASETPDSSLMVDDDDYSKMITLTGAEKLVLFFGRTDNISRSYLRVEGEQKVYEINFVLDNLNIESELWLEPKNNHADSDSK